MTIDLPIARRRLLGAGLAGAAGLAAAGLLPAWAHSGTHGLARRGGGVLTGEDIRLSIGPTAFSTGGRTGHHAVTVNGSLPAPLIRLREGQRVRLHVTNHLDEDSSIHWHGLILPFEMDGVPGVSFPGIRPGETFLYEFPIVQAGTYWYHSHSGLQEQQGVYGPLVIDPAGADPAPYDREHVIVLSDWSFLHPHRIFLKLKQQGGYFNNQRMTIAGRAAGNAEDRMPLAERLEWARMRMDPTDISDVTGETYTFLMNGHGPDENWTGLFRPGERVRLRVVNAAAMTNFNLRLPGLPMRVVNADGLDVRPVEVDELQIAVAETYDVIVTPRADAAFAVVAEAVDRSGMAAGTLAPRMGMRAAPPPLRPRPTLSMRDMGHGARDHGGHDGHGGAGHGSMRMRDPANAPPHVRVGVGTDMIAPAPVDRTGDPGLGLEEVEHRVLTYRDLMALTPNPDMRPPGRSVEVHLTGNMERFMWSLDGRRFSEGMEPIRLERDEKVRFVLVNDTMMAHPIHLHGHFFALVNGHTGSYPMKHTVNVLPGGKVEFDLTADAPGDWAFHCHLLFHMHAGMFNVVTVRPLDRAEGGAA